MINKEIISKVAKKENVNEKYIWEGLKAGSIVILNNKNRNIENPVGIGKGLSTKVNANIGTSLDYPNIKDEIKKLKVAIEAGADTIMDLSTAGDLDLIRRKIIENSNVPVGTVPIYQVAVEAKRKYKDITKISKEHIFETIEKHCQDGVDFITVHCGVTEEVLKKFSYSKRTTGIVSRGGAILACWIIKNKKENPLYEDFETLLKIAKKYNVVLSLGDGLRPGSISDATDIGQISELFVLGELVEKARKENVQVMVEGPGHIPLNQIEINVKLQKIICKEAPFYVLGPLPCDIGAGYDHILGAIGGALAGYYGADFLCYLTPAEHLGLPTISDVREGVIVTKLAAHCADVAKGKKEFLEWNRKLSLARKSLRWEEQLKLLFDSKKAAKFYKKRKSKFEEVCSMCGEYCPLKITKEINGI
jgi:phosphomethylpyrimidine synthase